MLVLSRSILKMILLPVLACFRLVVVQQWQGRRRRWRGWDGIVIPKSEREEESTTVAKVSKRQEAKGRTYTRRLGSFFAFVFGWCEDSLLLRIHWEIACILLVCGVTCCYMLVLVVVIFEYVRVKDKIGSIELPTGARWFFTAPDSDMGLWWLNRRLPSDLDWFSSVILFAIL